MHISCTIWSSLAVASTLFVQLATASPAYKAKFPPYDYGRDNTTPRKRRSSQYYAITGVHTGSGPNGSVPLRLEIRDLEKDPIAWTLYILGLDMLQYTSQDDMLSWYQIAGIHGRPFEPFDNVQPEQGDNQSGYCNHVSILFPIWHRPYVALFEQVLYGNVQMIAQRYPAGSKRDQYVSAAANFRVPYWDWAAVPSDGASIFPSSIGGSPSVLVDGPAGPQTIANPLYSYRFKPLDTGQLPNPPFDEYPETLRYPTSTTASADSQNNLIAKQLDHSALSFRSRLYILLTMYKDYTTFSNEAWISEINPAGYDSIESIHDQIHGLTGSGGHMTYINYSAFDPLFFLHHAMIDRIFAMWQVINPNSYVVPEPARYDTFTLLAGQVQDINSPLTPFHKHSAGTFWTSDTARTTEVFGYAYPETANSTGIDVRSQVIAAVNRLYGSGFTVLMTAKRDTQATSHVEQEWIANIRVKKFALGVPFYVHIFVGPFSPDPVVWSFDPNLVGTHSIFVKAFSPSPNANTEQLVTATIPLTERLRNDVSQEKLKSLGEADVTQYLASNFQYRLSFMNDTEVSNADVPSLKISVVSIEVNRSQGENILPVWGKMRGHMDVSTG